MGDAGQSFLTLGSSISLLVASMESHTNDNVLDAALRLARRYEQLRVILTAVSSPEISSLELMREAGIRLLSLPYSFSRFSRTVGELAETGQVDLGLIASESDVRGSTAIRQWAAH